MLGLIILSPSEKITLSSLFSICLLQKFSFYLGILISRRVPLLLLESEKVLCWWWRCAPWSKSPPPTPWPPVPPCHHPTAVQGPAPPFIKTAPTTDSLLLRPPHHLRTPCAHYFAGLWPPPQLKRQLLWWLRPIWIQRMLWSCLRACPCISWTGFYDDTSQDPRSHASDSWTRDLRS